MYTGCGEIVISQWRQFAASERLLPALVNAPARIIELIAPAGFGKTTLALALGRAVGHYEVVEPTGDDLTRALERNAAHDFVAVIDNADRIPCHEIAALASAIEMAPPSGRIVLCSRRETTLNRGLTIAPNERITLSARDLALRDHEILSLFQGIEMASDSLNDVLAISEGWPVVVCSLRAALGQQVAAAEEVRDVSLHALDTYFMREVVDALSKDECEALWLCSAMPGVRRPQIVKVLSNPSAAFALVDLQLASYDRFGGIVPRQILARLMYGRYRNEMADVAARAAAALRNEGDLLYASAAFLAANDISSACEVLQTFSDSPGKLLRFPFHAIAQQTRDALDGATIKACPELWTALFLERQFADTPDALLHDAREIARMLGSSHDSLRNVVLALGGLLAIIIGRRDLAEQLLHEGSASDSLQTDDPAIITSVRAVLAAHRGKPLSASALWLSVRPQFWGYEAWCALMMLVQIKSARATSEPEGALAVAERMCEAAEKTGSPLIEGYAFAVVAFTAWIFGEDQRSQTYVSRLHRAIRQTSSIHLALFWDMLAGRYEHLSGYPIYFGWAKLIRAASSEHAQAVRLAGEAIDIAESCTDAALGVMARIALAELQPELQPRLEEEAKTIAEPDIDVSARHPRYQPFVRRFQRTNDPAVSQDAIYVEVARGRVRKGERELELSLKSLELVMALAVEAAPVARDVLFERLWPGQAADAARSALKMAVLRARAQLGDQEAILARQGTYALGEDVTTDACKLFAREADIPDLEETFERLSGGRPSIFTAWEWFRPYEDRLIALAAKMGLALASRAFAGGDVAGALRYASVLTNLDPCDETATELAIRAHLELGERSLAISRYRQLMRALKNELDVEPSDSLRALLSSGLPG